VLAIGHDSGHLTPFGRDLILCLRESARVDAAVRTPMTAVKGHRDRAGLQERIKADKLPLLVRQDEIWHRLAGLRCIFADIVISQPLDQAVNRVLEMRAEPPHCVGESLQPVRQ
jgi:hypothetical protein